METINEKSEYCLNCKSKPCQSGCPLDNDIPNFISLIKSEKCKEAYNVITKTTVLSSICGRICPHMSQCMGKCVRGIKGKPVSIGELEAKIGDMGIENSWDFSEINSKGKNKKVAIIGGGPSGLTCAAFLAKSGVNVTIYEKYNTLGGLLRYGIPEFRLPKDILDKTINKILELGIKVVYQKELGVNLYINELLKEYDSIFIAIGANIPWKMNIEGESLKGVYGGNSLLEKANHPDYKNKKVAIIGGGNVAMDCARTIKKLGAQDVKIIYRRAEKQMPAEEKEIFDAKNENIEFLFQNNIVKILGNEKVESIECIRTELVSKEGENRLVPVNVEGSKYSIPIDYVVMAIGSSPEEKIVNMLGLELTSKGYIKVNENFQTSMQNVYAGGDIVGQKSTVAWAANIGRKVAENILKS